jgi:hypothetical protein
MQTAGRPQEETQQGPTVDEPDPESEEMQRLVHEAEKNAEHNVGQDEQSEKEGAEHIGRKR